MRTWLANTNRGASLWLALALTGLVLLQSCAPSTLFLKKDQYLFTRARIRGAKGLDAEALSSLQQQKPNSQILYSTPYLWFYQLGARFYKPKKEQEKYDSLQKSYKVASAALGNTNTPAAQKWRARKEKRLERQRVKVEEGNWLMRTVGEPPSIFDSAALNATHRELGNYLFNKGYFDGKVLTVADTNGKAVRVVHTITLGQPQILRQIRYLAYDTAIQRALTAAAKDEPRVRPGDRYDQDAIAAERERLDKLMHNQGYYTFSRDYIYVDADTSPHDTSQGPRIIDLTFQIKNPLLGRHHRYTLAEEEFRILPASEYETQGSVEHYYEKILYITPSRRVSYRTLDSKILVRPGEYYNAQKLTVSQAQLQAMDIFRFVNFSYDTLPGRPHDFRLQIQATRLPKYQVSNEVGLLISQGAPGPFINESFKIRNALNTFDVFDIGARYSQEGQISIFNQQGIYRATELGITAAITFPAIILPWYTSYLFNAKTPKTRLTTGYTNRARPEFSQNELKATLGYSINLDPKRLLGINLADVSVVNTTRIQAGYLTFLEDQRNAGNPLIRSFDNQIVTSLSAFYVYNTAGQSVKKARGLYFRLFAELGGFLPNILATSYNDTSRSGRYIVNDNAGLSLRVFRFTKLQLDYRYYMPVAQGTLWVARFNAGVAIPIGESRALPYVKYFFSGGSNSIRAWAPRRLGPGTYNVQTSSGFNAEQPGEVLIEANIELRQKLFGFVEGALFADLGNVFTLKNEEGRPGSQILAKTVLQSLALGVGPGIRMDFSFLVIRLDAGIKTYDPSAPQGVKWVIRDALRKNTNGYQRILLNIGIGYPF